MKSPLVVNSDDLQKIKKEIETKEFKVDENVVAQVEKDSAETIPTGYIPIKLPSNGKIEGVPKKLHFRDYSATEALQINTPNEEDRPQAIGKVLSSMCLENIDISKLPIEDVLYILLVLQATFISNEIEKKIYLDETLDESEIDKEENVETVTIPITKLKLTYLGKDKDDNDLKEKVRIPFKVKDNKTGNEIVFKLATLKDSIIAQNYCKEFYADEFLKFAPTRKQIYEIQSIKNDKIREEKIEKFMNDNFDDCQEYYNFMTKYATTMAECIQALQIVSYNGKECKSLSECWDIYSTIPSNIWNIYNSILEKFQFGLNKQVEVYSNKLEKTLVRTISFQLSDFISINESKDNDRYSVCFD